MRSRYSAFVVRDAGYLRRTWDESTCPAVIDLSDDVDWLGLDIVDAPAPGPFHNTATVAFVARYRRAGARSAMAETSLFRRTAGGWRYVRPVVTTD